MSEQQKNYFIAEKDRPHHLSVGAVLVNKKGEVCCHYFKDISEKVYGDLKDFYILMRETIKPGESLEHAVKRGLQEEFGAKGEIATYLGPLKADFVKKGETFEKTTLYFLVKVKSFKPEKRLRDDIESESEIQWQSPDFLIAKMKEQGVRLSAQALDESAILERAKIHIRNLDDGRYCVLPR